MSILIILRRNYSVRVQAHFKRTLICYSDNKSKRKILLRILNFAFLNSRWNRGWRTDGQNSFNKISYQEPQRYKRLITCAKCCRYIAETYKNKEKKTFIPRCQRLETTYTIPHFSQNRKIERKKEKTENKNRFKNPLAVGEGVLIWYPIDLTIRTARSTLR